MTSFLAFALSLCLFAVVVSGESVRTWTDSSGFFQSPARITEIDVVKKRITLKKPDGEQASLKFSDISTTDLKYVRDVYNRTKNVQQKPTKDANGILEEVRSFDSIHREFFGHLVRTYAQASEALRELDDESLTAIQRENTTKHPSVLASEKEFRKKWFGKQFVCECTIVNAFLTDRVKDWGGMYYQRGARGSQKYITCHGIEFDFVCQGENAGRPTAERRSPTVYFETQPFNRISREQHLKKNSAPFYAFRVILDELTDKQANELKKGQRVRLKGEFKTTTPKMNPDGCHSGNPDHRVGDPDYIRRIDSIKTGRDFQPGENFFPIANLNTQSQKTATFWFCVRSVEIAGKNFTPAPQRNSHLNPMLKQGWGNRNDKQPFQFR